MSTPRIQIQLMGGFSIMVDGKPVLAALSQARKLQQILQYLLLNCGRAVSHQELIANFWGDGSDAEASLRAVMHRLRQMAAHEGSGLENCVLTGRGTYQWNPSLICRIDVREMERLAAEAQAAPADQRDALEQQMLELYRGRLLPDSQGESWVDRRQVELQALYKTALYHQIECARANGDMVKAEALSRRGLSVDIADERLYMEQILLLQTLGKTDEAAAVTEQARVRGYLHTDDTGFGSLEASYQRMRKAEEAMQRDANHIEEEIRLGGSDSGAFICSYATFRSISRVQMRVSVRYNHPLFLATISLIPPVARPAGGRTAAAMQVLENVLMRTLRSSDVAARYSENRFVLLLNGIVAAGNCPMERVRTEFYQCPEHDGYLLTYRLHTPHLN